MTTAGSKRKIINRKNRKNVFQPPANKGKDIADHAYQWATGAIYACAEPLGAQGKLKSKRFKRIANNCTFWSEAWKTQRYSHGTPGLDYKGFAKN
jgi:hypothetical protein